MYIKEVRTYCEEAYVNSATYSTLFRGDYKHWTKSHDPRTRVPKDPRTRDRGKGTQGPKDQGPKDLAVFYSAFMTEMQLQTTYSSQAHCYASIMQKIDISEQILS